MSLDTETACLLREIGLRKRVYPRSVVADRTPQTQADHEVAMMEEAVYRRLVALREQQSLFDVPSGQKESAP